MSGVIVDFDGTIANSLPTVIKLFYAWSGSPPFSQQQIDSMRNMTLKEVLRQLGVPLWRVPKLLVTARKDFGQLVDQVPVFDGVPEALKQLHDNGHKLYVISSNSPTNICKFLRLHNMESSFDGVHGNMGLFGKAAAMRSIMRKNKRVDNWYAIGDETRDIEAAKKAHITSIAVDWGYNGHQILAAHQPDFLISQPSELVKLLQ